jgi:hypothetical protein
MRRESLDRAIISAGSYEHRATRKRSTKEQSARNVGAVYCLALVSALATKKMTSVLLNARALFAAKENNHEPSVLR